MKIEKTTKKSPAEIKAAADKLLSELGNTYKVKGEWNNEGNIFTITNPCKGVVGIGAGKVIVQLSLTGLMALAEGTITKAINAKLDELL